MDAKKVIYNGTAAWEVVDGAVKVYVANGKKIVEYAPSAANKEEMLKMITGRTGNLRAPAVKCGNVFYIGYNQEMYENLL